MTEEDQNHMKLHAMHDLRQSFSYKRQLEELEWVCGAGGGDILIFMLPS